MRGREGRQGLGLVRSSAAVAFQTFPPRTGCSGTRRCHALPVTACILASLRRKTRSSLGAGAVGLHESAAGSDRPDARVACSWASSCFTKLHLCLVRACKIHKYRMQNRDNNTVGIRWGRRTQRKAARFGRACPSISCTVMPLYSLAAVRATPKSDHRPCRRCAQCFGTMLTCNFAGVPLLRKLLEEKSRLLRGQLVEVCAIAARSNIKPRCATCSMVTSAGVDVHTRGTFLKAKSGTPRSYRNSPSH